LKQEALDRNLWCRNYILQQNIARKIEERTKWMGNEEEEVSSYLITLRKRDDTGN
jgi:hypothetical protein